MAIFGSKKKKNEKVGVKAAPVKAVAATVGASGAVLDHASVIIRPRITEKSGILSQTGRYTFQVGTNANKEAIAKAVKTLYKVTPVKVSIINVAARNVFVKGRHGTVSGFKKAVVTLKAGDKIEFV